MNEEKTEISAYSKRLILDHGHVTLIEAWGSDERIIEAARMSTQKGFAGWGAEETCSHCKGTMREPGFGPNHTCRECSGKGTRIEKPGDEKLLSYLYKNGHMTPFEMAGAIIEVQAPIFVFREWHRHRTQSYNEMSARYAPLPDLNYLPTVDRMMVNAGTTNKQAGTIAGSSVLTRSAAVEILLEEEEFNAAAERFYQKKLAAGVPKELARTHLAVSRYSRMRAQANLRNWLGFLTLRADGAAQYEIRMFAHAVSEIIKALFPRTWNLWNEEQAKS